MHEIELKLRNFLERLRRGEVTIDDDLAESYAAVAAASLKRQLSPRDNSFRIRLSGVGRPICQLLHDQAGTPAEPMDLEFPVKMLFGDMAEGMAIALLAAAGVEVTAYQEEVSFPIDHDSPIGGTLDVVIRTSDGVESVWDIKSASKWAFENKFTSFDALKAHDDFGYIDQLYGYAKGYGLPAGGWIVMCKETGEIAVVAAPSGSAGKLEERQAVARINAVVNTLRTHPTPILRHIPDKPETYRKKPTGNRVLDRTCTYCAYKAACWPNLEYRPSLVSATGTMTYYTHIEENN